MCAFSVSTKNNTLNFLILEQIKLQQNNKEQTVIVMNLILLSLIFTVVELHGKVVFPVGTPDQGLFEGDIKLTAKQEKVVKAAIKRGGLLLIEMNL